VQCMRASWTTGHCFSRKADEIGPLQGQQCLTEHHLVCRGQAGILSVLVVPRQCSSCVSVGVNFGQELTIVELNRDVGTVA
jgi:hypothetical protein